MIIEFIQKMNCWKNLELSLFIHFYKEINYLLFISFWRFNFINFLSNRIEEFFNPDVIFCRCFKK